MTDKLIICSLTMEFGGAERRISVIANEMARHGRNVEILLYYDREICYNIDDKVKITIVEQKTHSVNKVKNLIWIRKYLMEQNCTVLSFLSSLNMLIITALRGIPNKLIVADTGDPSVEPVRKSRRRIRDFLYRYPDVVVVQTRKSQKYFETKSKVRRYAVIPNPTAVPLEYKGLALKAVKRDEIVCVGRLIQGKNPLMLLHAFRKFREEHSSYRLLFYGDGEYRGTVEKEINELNLNESVILCGNAKDVIDRILNAKMFVMTTNNEGMSNALIEAMCLGLPCVSTRVNGAEDLIHNGTNGLLIDIGDVQGCVEAMNMIADNEGKAREMGIEASKVFDILRPDVNIEEWISVLDIR